jgi:RHS repeat-associated protein
MASRFARGRLRALSASRTSRSRLVAGVVACALISAPLSVVADAALNIGHPAIVAIAALSALAVVLLAKLARRSRLGWRRGVRTVAFLVVGAALVAAPTLFGGAPVAADPVATDNFNDNKRDSALWNPSVGSQEFNETTDHSSLDIAGDLDVRVVLSLRDWTPTTENFVFGKWQDSTNRSYWLSVLSSGLVRLAWSHNGTTIHIEDSSVAPSVANGQAIALRAILDVDNGANDHVVRFYTKSSTPSAGLSSASSDSGWSQLGSDRSAAGPGVTSIFNSTAILKAGDPGTLAMFGDYHAAVLKSGINGATVAAPNFHAAGSDASSFTDTAGRPWTVHLKPTESERNQRLEVTLPASARGVTFGAGYSARCLLTGDFDVQVDYELMSWPTGNGVHVELGVASSTAQGRSVERLSQSDVGDIYTSGWPTAQVNVATSDETGGLRLRRSGTTFDAYYWNAASWTKFNTYAGTATDLRPGLSVWSRDSYFTGQEVKTTFDDYVVNSGTVNCGPPIITADQMHGGCDNTDAAVACDEFADPIVSATGAFVHSETDVEIPGVGVPFKLARTYTSGDAADGPLGRGWSLSYGESLTFAQDGDATLHAANGQRVTFNKDPDGSFVAPANGRSILAEVPTGYKLTRRDKTVHFFDPQGKLTEITDRSGNSLTFGYDGSDRLGAINDTAGRTISLTYDVSGRITAVTLPDDRQVSYGYTDGYLTSFTDLRGKTSTYTYSDEGALSLDGLDDYVRIPDDTTFDNAGALTLEAIVRFDAVGAGRVQRIISRQAESTVNGTWYLRANGAKLQTGFSDSTWTGTPLLGTTTLETGRWYHVASTLSGGTVRLYLDGVEEASTTFSPTGHFNLRAPVFLGQYSTDAAPAGERLDGQLSEARVWTTARTQPELAASLDPGALTGSEPGLAGLWELGGGSGTAVTDRTANGNDGTIQGGGSWPATKRMTSFTNSAGQAQVTNVYDSSGRVISQDDALGNTSVFTYAAETGGKLTATMHDARGQTWIHEYLNNVLQRKVDPLDAETVYEWDDHINLAHVPQPGGTPWILDHDQSSNLTSRKAVSPFDFEETYTYDADDNVTSSTDGLGRTTSYVYDAESNLESVTEDDGATTAITRDPTTGLPTEVTDARGKVWTYAYDADGNLASVTSPLGNETTMTYDDRGFMTSRTDPRGNEAGADPADFTITYTYDDAGNVLTETDTLDGQTVYTYDDAGRLATRTDARGKTTTSSYNAAGELTKVTAPDGGETTLDYDESGHLTEETDAEGGVTSYDYDAAGRMVSRTDPRGKVWTYGYDATGRRTSETTPLGNETTYAFDVLGRTTSRVDPRGNAAGADPNDFTWSYVYDAVGNLSSETDPLGNATSYTYNERNSQLTRTDPAGKVWTKTYDDAGNLLTEADPLANTVTYAYDDDGRLASTTDARGKTTTNAYDAASNLVEVTSPRGNKTTMGFDALNRVVSRTEPRGNVAGATAENYTAHTNYDPVGHVLSEIDALDKVTTYTYDDAGHAATRKDALDRTTAYTYDKLGRLKTLLAPDAALTSYGYDAAGNMTTRTDANNHTTTFVHNDDGRLVEERTPLGNKRTYAYDASGNATSEVDPRGNATPTLGDYTISRAYDASGRLTGIDYSDATPDVAYSYDARGLRTSMTDGAGAESRAYDDAGRLSSVTRGSTSISYLYDAAGNITRRTYPGAVVNLTYDDDGRMSTVAGPGGTATYSRDATGNATSLARPNGTNTLTSFDRVGRVAAINHRKGSLSFTRFAYSYDAVGNPTTIATPEGDNHFRYDPQDRLVAECYILDCGDLSVPTYTYDKVGNRLTKQDLTGATAHTYDADDRLLATVGTTGTTTYAHDAAGNMTTAGTRTLTYDLAGRTKTIVDSSGSAPHTYTYDGEGKRLSASRSGLFGATYSSSFLWDPNGSLPQLVRGSGPEGYRTYVYGEDLLSGTLGGATSWYHADNLGTVLSLTDGAGDEDWTYRYEAFGPERLALHRDPTAAAQPMRYTGQYSDPTDLYHMRSRQFESSLGLFLARDPLPPIDNRPEVGRYVYADNRPTIMRDPRGERPEQSQPHYTAFDRFIDRLRQFAQVGAGDTDWYVRTAGWRLGGTNAGLITPTRTNPPEEIIGEDGWKAELVDGDRSPARHFIGFFAIGYFHPHTARTFLGMNESPPMQGRSVQDIRSGEIAIDIGRLLRFGDISTYGSINQMIVRAHDPNHPDRPETPDTDTPRAPECDLPNWGPIPDC